jgi:hypothetical protein
MKKYFCLILFLFTTITFSQKFEFDFVTEYVVKHPDYDKTTTTYSNSKNPNYIFMIHHKFPTKSGSLFDFENKKIHTFKVTTKKENDKVIYEFKFKKSRKINPIYFENKKNYKFEFFELKNDLNFKTVLLKSSYIVEGYTFNSSIEIKIQKIDANYFPSFRVGFLHPWEMMTNLDLFENGLVVESVQIRNGERVYPSKLVHSEEVELELVVPN